jgi:decaprenylphospho-beta-D-ribofuranose 2-oxidase
MSVADSGTERLQELHGWGRTNRTQARVLRLSSPEQLARALSEPSGGIIARGCGRAYGDAAQCRGGRVIDMRSWREVLSFDASTGLLTAQAGVTVRQLQRAFVPLGWSLAVVPGTQEVTLGGAIAADVHGKNHERDGTFGRHLVGVRLRLPGGEAIDLGAADADEAFLATVGGMGLTGVMETATLRLKRISSPLVSVDTERTADLEATIAMLADDTGGRRYSVSWIDALSRGPRLGRGIVTKGDFAAAGEESSSDGIPPRARLRLTVPERWSGGLLRPVSVGAFNEMNWRHAPRSRRGELVDHESFFFPLDAALEWNRLYGPAGFFQYQFVVPFGEEHVLRGALELLQRHAVPVYLAILKRFGDSDPGLLSFPMPGWTLALDLPARAPRALEAMSALDEMVAAAGGRVYLAKDARMHEAHLAGMYPKLERWRAVQAELDPRGLLSSDLARRLRLVAPRAQIASTSPSEGKGARGVAARDSPSASV